jgi:hypothetical protein
MVTSGCSREKRAIHAVSGRGTRNRQTLTGPGAAAVSFAGRPVRGRPTDGASRFRRGTLRQSPGEGYSFRGPVSTQIQGTGRLADRPPNTLGSFFNGRGEDGVPAIHGVTDHERNRDPGPARRT